MNRLFLASVIAFSWLCGRGQQTDMRINPEIGVEEDRYEVELSEYPFLKADANVIRLNGADWSGLRHAFSCADSQVVSIVHIGDSHVQPEGNTRHVRSALQKRFGSAGRGMVAPLRMAGTNSPADYSLSSGSDYISSRLMKAGHPAGMGMSGVAVAPAGGNLLDLTVKADQPFDRVRIHTTGDASVDVCDVDSSLMAGYISPTSCLTELLLTDAATEATLHLLVPQGSSITAMELLSGNCGVEYSAIGNNGATYSAYNGIAGFGEAVARMHPQLIVLSLGTNEGFGTVTEDGLCTQIAALMGELRRHNPQAQFLLTTPQECYKRTYVRSGGKRRRRVGAYQVNGNVARVRDIINMYALSHHIPVWDWYEVSGGSGSGAKWLKHGLMNKDRLHLTWPGYSLQGELLAQALLNEITNSSQENPSVGDDSVR